MPAPTQTQDRPTAAADALRFAATRATERIASELLNSETCAEPADALSRAVQHAIASVVRALLDPAQRAPSSHEGIIDTCNALREHASAIKIDELYQHLLTLRPAVDAASGCVTLRPHRGAARRTQGSFYTPEPLVRHVLSTTLARVIQERLADVPAALPAAQAARARCDAILSIRVCDPACGSGRFLATARDMLALSLALERSGQADPAPAQVSEARVQVARTCLFGVDIDPVAATLCRHALSDGAPISHPEHIRVGNALLWTSAERINELDLDDRHAAFEWDREFPEVFDQTRTRAPGFDVVVGNPPFLNQLEQATAVDRKLAALINEILEGGASGYADAATAFLLLALRLTADGGRMSLVMPQSFLAARDAAPARETLARRAHLDALWVANERVFDGASVLTCAPSFHITSQPIASTRRFSTSRFIELDPIDASDAKLANRATWSHLAACASGIPAFEFDESAVVGTLCEATADFRDQYYGLSGFIVEHDELTPQQQPDRSAFPPIVTSGLIDLAQCHWGAKACRLLKSRWNAPRIDRARMAQEGSLAPWLEARLVPKLILATQTRVMEVFADTDGAYVPSVPLISVVPRRAADYWLIAAALGSPVVSAYALRHYAGAALHADAIKLSAKQVLGLPLPTDTQHWQRAADQFQRASSPGASESVTDLLIAFGASACKAYALDDEASESVMDWWTQRLKPRRR